MGTARAILSLDQIRRGKLSYTGKIDFGVILESAVPVNRRGNGRSNREAEDPSSAQKSLGRHQGIKSGLKD